jgi:hypothetical protein
MPFLSLVLFVPIAVLVVDDFRRRQVGVAWIVVTAAAAAGITIARIGTKETLIQTALNLAVVAYMAVGVVAWAWIKARKPVNPLNRFIGLGDALFFVAITPMFPLKTFAWLVVASMVFSLAWWRSKRNVPLVATSGIVTCGAIIIDLVAT